MRKWTPQQDKAVMEASKQNPDHLRNAFAKVAKQIGRSTESVVTRFYNKLNKQNKTN